NGEIGVIVTLLQASSSDDNAVAFVQGDGRPFRYFRGYVRLSVLAEGPLELAIGCEGHELRRVIGNGKDSAIGRDRQAGHGRRIVLAEAPYDRAALPEAAIERSVGLEPCQCQHRLLTTLRRHERF